MEKGLVHVYTGDGKGKTTAALGLAIRSAGWGKRVLIIHLHQAQAARRSRWPRQAGLFRFQYTTKIIGTHLPETNPD